MWWRGGVNHSDLCVLTRVTTALGQLRQEGHTHAGSFHSGAEAQEVSSGQQVERPRPQDVGVPAA